VLGLLLPGKLNINNTLKTFKTLENLFLIPFSTRKIQSNLLVSKSMGHIYLVEIKQFIKGKLD
jgi:ABC-type anion transport system duplicated permease subunit